MADLGEVYADLVRAARFKTTFDDCVICQVLDRTDVGDCPLGTLGGFAERGAAAEAVAAVANEPGVDGLCLDAAGDDGNICPLDVVLGEHANESLLGLGSTGKNHEATGVAVEPVD